MASQKTAEIAVVTRTYQGLEGNRVYAGTRLAIGKKQGDLKVISLARFNQLRDNHLVRPLSDEDGKAAPARARYGAEGPLEVQGEGTSVQLARNVRKAARARSRQPEEPQAPRKLDQTGSQTGQAKSESSSAAAQASATSTSGSRGRRAGNSESSRSTTPSR